MILSHKAWLVISLQSVNSHVHTEPFILEKVDSLA